MSAHSCFFKADEIKTVGLDKNKIGGKASQPSGSLSAGITSVSIVNDQLVLNGSGLDEVETVRITGPSGFDETFSIESKSSSNLVANGLKNIAFVVGSLFELTVSNAFGAATFQVTFTLQDGAVTAAKLSDMGASVGQVLKYNGTTWVPSDLSSLTYAGNWDANTNSPDLTSGGNTGEYYIVNVAGSTDLLGGTGTDNWGVGDWVVWNNVSARWEKIDNATNVTSFNGRNGPVSSQSGDYDYSQIANGAGVYLDYQPANSACTDGQVLKYDSGIPGWKCDNDIDTVGTGDITAVNAGTGLLNGGLSGDVTLDVNVGTGANQIPQLDGSGLLVPSTIPNIDASKVTTGTVDAARLPYASGSADGILSSADYNTLAAKEGSITAGTTAQYFRGDKSWQTLDTAVVPENTNLYFTDARAKAAVISPLISNGVTDMSPSEDAVFDALALKQGLIDNTTNLDVGTVRVYDSVDQSNYVELQAPAISANQVFTLPGVDGTTGQVLSTNGSGTLSWVSPSTGSVTSVTASAPLSSTGGATPDISISQATTTTDGYLSSTDWNTFNNKEGTITAGTTAQYFRGDKSWQTLDTDAVTEGTNLYYTTARARGDTVADAIVDGVLNIAPSQNAVFDALALKENSITAGTTAQYYRGDKTFQTLDTGVVPENGNLYYTTARAKADTVADAISDAVTDVAPSQNAVFDALALKQDNLTSTTNANVGTVRIYDSVDQSNYVELQAPAITANQTFTLPGVDGTSGQVLSTNGSGVLTWTTPSGGSVTGVTATAPLASSGGTAPDISITQANTTTDGYLSSTDWNTFNNKEGAITAGTTAQYFRGDKSWQTLDTDAVTEGTNLYYTTARARGDAVSDAIVDGIVNVAPSQNAVFDGLATKLDTTTAAATYVELAGDTMTGTLNVPEIGLTTGGDRRIFQNSAEIKFIDRTTQSGSILIQNDTQGIDVDGGDITIQNRGGGRNGTVGILGLYGTDTSNQPGGVVEIAAGDATAAGNGGDVKIFGGASLSNTNVNVPQRGGNVVITGGTNDELQSGTGTRYAGSVLLQAGQNTAGTAENGFVDFQYHNGTSYVTGMRFNGQNGRFGIGTTTPESELDVSGTIRAVEVCDELGANCKDVSAGWGDSTIGTYRVASGFFSIAGGTCNTVGSPCTVDISAGGFTAAPNCTITMRNSDGTGYTENIVIKSITTTNLNFWKGNYQNEGTTLQGYWVCTSGNGGGNPWDVNGANINLASGNVGIGAPTPTEKLQVAGTIHSTTGGIKFPDNSVQTTAVGVSASITNGDTTNAPSSDAVFDALATKEPTITAGTTAQYWRGDKSWQTLDTLVVPENGNLYFTDGRAQAAAVTQSITNGNTTRAPSSDAVFDALALKQDAASATSDFVNVTGDTMTGTLNLPANGLVTGTNQLVVSGGNVGVGTASPAGPLHIATVVDAGTNNPGTASFIIGPVNGGHIEIDDNEIEALTDATTAGTLNLQTDGGETRFGNNLGGLNVVTVKDGKVGVGNSAPASRLDLSDTTPVLIMRDTNSANTDNLFSGYISGRDSGESEVWWVGDGSGTVKRVSLAAMQPDYEVNMVNDSGTVHLDNAGNVGIGTTTPKERLDVNGELISHNRYTRTVTFTDGWAVGDFIDVVQAAPNAAGSASLWEVNISGTRNSWTESSTYKIAGSHSADSVWREAGQISDNTYVGNTKCFTVDFRGNGNAPQFRVRAVKASGSCGVAGADFGVRFIIRSISNNDGWSDLANSGSGATVTGHQSMGHSYNLITGTPRNTDGKYAIHANANGDVGIGKNSADAKLDVNGPIITGNTPGNTQGAVTMGVVNYFTSDNNGTDYIHLRMPYNIFSGDSDMYHVKVTGYAYGSSQIIDLTYVGYVYGATNSLQNTNNMDPTGALAPTQYIGSDNNLYLRFKPASVYYLTFRVDSMHVGNGRVIKPGEITVIKSPGATL